MSEVHDLLIVGLAALLGVLWFRVRELDAELKKQESAIATHKLFTKSLENRIQELEEISDGLLRQRENPLANAIKNAAAVIAVAAVTNRQHAGRAADSEHKEQANGETQP